MTTTWWAGRQEFALGPVFYAGDIADGPLGDRIFAEHPDIYAVVLGWRAQHDLTEGIRHSLQWAALRDEIPSGRAESFAER
ncbi:hypothetical protein [Trebonia kvetii]|uniref:hypothetical protein n=1 Tax=Trebonia kvetii TaxID=2480626 RepID=UPI001651C4D0|nr:hypothetical protein [Trebonia kvetii]